LKLRPGVHELRGMAPVSEIYTKSEIVPIGRHALGFQAGYRIDTYVVTGKN